jgi:CubicO group peptidase (beta-lactamase class C family)
VIQVALVFSLVCMLMVQAGSTAVSPSQDDLKARLEKELVPFIEKVMADQETPGLAVGVVHNGEIVFLRGFGVKDLDTGEPVTPESLFHMASISKTFVATAVVQLIEKGLVKLDDPVVKHLPYFKLADERYKQITVHQMLSHISGMPDVDDYEWEKPQYDNGALERYVRSLADLKLEFEPGERFAYSNMAYEVLGDLVAKVSGMTFEDYVKRNILDPLGMKESNFLRAAVSPALTTSPHIRALVTEVSPFYPYNRIHAPSSTLHSSAAEMCRWAMANINRGALDGNRILNSSSYDVMWKKWSDAFGDMGVGLSWFIGEYKGNPMVSHGGGDVGYTTNLVILPETGTAVVVLCNEIPSPVRAVTNAALDIVLGLEPEVPKIPISIPVGRTLKEKGFDAALQQFIQLKSKEDYDAGTRQFFFLVNSVLLGLDRLEDAANVGKLLVQGDPGNVDGYRILARAYRQSGEIQSALGTIKKALEIDPDNADLQRDLKSLQEAIAKEK